MKKIPIYLLAIVFAVSCKKNLDVEQSITQKVLTPTVVKLENFQHPILKFENKESFKTYWKNIDNNSISEFKSFKKFVDEFRAEKSNATKTLNTVEEVVSQQEFLNDVRESILPDESLGNIVNPDLQVIVQDTLYQFTRIGVFLVDQNYVANYSTLYQSIESDINYNSNYNSVPNETVYGTDQYLVQPGIVRYDMDMADPLNQVNQVPFLPGYGPTPVQTDNISYVTKSFLYDFNESIEQRVTDWAKRRIIFTANKISLDAFGWGLHKVSINCRVQREKKFLWVSYWAPSFADEIIVGCDNMYLETGMVFAHPQNFASITRPTFDGLANFDIGNNVVKALNLRVNLSALGYSLTNAHVAKFIDKSYNSFINGVYNSAFKQIESDIINTINPTYLSSYADYTKKVHELDDQNRLRLVIGRAEKKLGYSSSNEWWFDYNFGGTIVSQNGGVGGYPLQYSYGNQMKKGSFFAKVRLGNSWYGLRLVKL